MENVKRTLNLPQINGKDYDLPELTDEERQRVFDFFKTTEYVNGCEPDLNVVDFTMKCILNGVTVWILSARDNCIAKETEEWLRKHGFVFHKINCGINDKAKFISNFVSENNCFLLDDLPSNVCVVNKDLRASGIVYIREGQEYSKKSYLDYPMYGSIVKYNNPIWITVSENNLDRLLNFVVSNIDFDEYSSCWKNRKGEKL